MDFVTKCFGQFYKLFNPKRIPDKNWFTASFTTLFDFGQFGNGSIYSSSYGPMSGAYVDSGGKFLWFSSSFFNYPGNPVSTIYIPSPNPGGRPSVITVTDNEYVTTRYRSSSYYFRDFNNNIISMSAVPWGSQAGDFLWNALTPSWSYGEHNASGTDLITWTPTWTSKSFHSGFYPEGYLFGIGTASAYPVTSSWKVFDPKYVKFQYPYDTFSSQVGFPDPGGIGPVHRFATYSSCYKIHVDPLTGFVGNAAGLSPTTDLDFFNSVDNSVFDVGGGVAITQTEISTSLAIMDISGSSTSVNDRKAFDRALRSRRLYFPISYTTASSYWLKQFTGFSANEMFTENGGLYRVSFTLKRWNTAWAASDSASQSGNVFYDTATDTLKYNTGSWDMSTAYPAPGSFMNIFIHDVLSTTPAPSLRTPGRPGWYPPSTNIVTVGNGYGVTPIMTFIDTQTGLLQEKFDIVVVQYGYPAQLCFEPSGSAAAPFGCIIDDIEVCKIGVTTDPRFLKPQTVSTTTAIAEEQALDSAIVPTTNDDGEVIYSRR